MTSEHLRKMVEKTSTSQVKQTMKMFIVKRKPNLPTELLTTTQLVFIAKLIHNIYIAWLGKGI